MIFRVILSLFMFIGCIKCEIVSILAGTALTYAGYYSYKKVECMYWECCTDEYIHSDLDRLEYMLSANLFGQQIAHETIVNALRGHLANKDSQKALVLSLHGTPGTGKNYVAQMIATAFFKNGVQSHYYHFFNGRTDFPLQTKISEYKEELYKIISSSLKKCDKSIFVFDEVDKMPEGLLNVLVPFLDYSNYHKSSMHGIDTLYQGRAIFIFLSNTGSSQIVQILTNLWEKGRKREDMELQDFEQLIANGAFHEKGGFHQSDTIQTNVIDHYVPFLPLEEVHVRKCLKKAFSQRGVIANKEQIEEALSHLTFGPEPYNLYSMAGCKRIEQKVAAIVYRNKPEITQDDKSK